MSEVFETSIESLPLLGRGKVRDIYAVGEDKLLIVTTDRLSAYDVILPTPVPEKGRVLNDLANFWFGRLAPVIPNHLTGIDPERDAVHREHLAVAALDDGAKRGCQSGLTFGDAVDLAEGAHVDDRRIHGGHRVHADTGGE